MDNSDTESLLNDIFDYLPCENDSEIVYLYEGKREKKDFHLLFCLLNSDKCDPNVKDKLCFGYLDTNTAQLLVNMNIGKIIHHSWDFEIIDKDDLAFHEEQFGGKLEGVIREKLPKNRCTFKVNVAKLKEWKINNSNRLFSTTKLLNINPDGVKVTYCYNKNLLTIVYRTSSGTKYEANFKAKTNPYLLLEFLLKNVGKTFNFEILNNKLNKPRLIGMDSGSDRRVRDTVQAIRNKLKTTENDDMFLVDYGFGIKQCILQKLPNKS